MIDRQRIAAVKKLQELGYVFYVDSGWLNKEESSKKMSNAPKYGNASMGAAPVVVTQVNNWESAYRHLHGLYLGFPPRYQVSVDAVAADFMLTIVKFGLVLWDGKE